MIVNCYKVQSIFDKLCLLLKIVNIYCYCIFEKFLIISDVELVLFVVCYGMVDVVSQMSVVFDVSVFFVICSNCLGVYCMFDVDVKFFYVGKVKSLKKCLVSYFCKFGLVLKIVVLVVWIVQVEIIIIVNEIEVLLLEQMLIKEWWLFYNILLWDDKFYFFVFFFSEDEYLWLFLYCGVKKCKGCYFGFYLSVGVICESFNLLQKVFFVCQCEDSYFCNCMWFCL